MSSSPDVFLVNPPDLVAIWPRVAEIVESYPGIREQFTLGEIMVYLTNGNYQLWLGVDQGEIEGVMLTCVVRHNNTSKAHICGICGDHLFNKYIAIGLKKFEQWSCLMGCDEIVLDGRDKWEQVLTKFGYRRTLQMRKSVRQLLAH